GQTRERTVEPWRLTAKDHGWYLFGLDRDRQSQRSFRLSRITGKVRRAGSTGSVTVPDRIDSPAESTTTLTLALLPERAAALRRRAVPVPDAAAPSGREVYRMEVGDPHRWVAELAGYGESVLVLD